MRSWASSVVVLLGCVSTPLETPTPTEPATDAARFAESGQVVDATGEPVVDVFVTFSTECCIPDRTDADGSFTIGDVDPGPKCLITYGETAANGLLPRSPWRSRRRRPTSSKPRWRHRSSSSSAPDELQIARVSADRTPFGRTDLLDVFVLHPILSFIEPPGAVTFPAGPLAPGKRVRFDYETGTLEVVTTGIVEEDGPAHQRSRPGSSRAHLDCPHAGVMRVLSLPPLAVATRQCLNRTQLRQHRWQSAAQEVSRA